VLRIGILGAARIATRALIHPAREVPSATVAAIAARGQARADAFAIQHAIPTAYGSYEELLADPSIDAVYIPLPNALHAQWTLRAIEAGKHVLCEKPFTANLEEAQQVLGKAHNSGLVVMEAMHYRYHPLAQRLVTMIREGVIGTPRHVQCWTSWPVPDPGDIRYSYEMAGGALMDGGCYAIDCLRFAGLSEPTVTGALADPMPADSRVDRALAARLTSPSGMTGWFESAFTGGGEFRADVHVIGDEGQLFLRNFVLAHEGTLTLYPNGQSWPDPDADPGAPGDTTFAWQLRAFTAAVQEGTPFDTTAAHAVTTMRVIDDAYRAAGLPPRGFVSP
jgi:predicted dehydrogenase